MSVSNGKKKKSCYLWVFVDVFEDFKKNIEKRYGPDKSPSEVMTDFMVKFNQDASGKEVNYEAVYVNLRNRRIDVYRQETLIFKQLTHKPSSDGQPAYHYLISLAISLGSDMGLEKNLPAVFEKLQKHRCSPQDCFSRAELESFLELIELVVQRRQLDADMNKLRVEHPELGLKRLLQSNVES